MTVELFVLAAVLFPALIALLVLRRVEDMEAVVVREQVGGQVVGLYVGPRLYVKLPGVDTAQRLDLHVHRTTLQAQSVQTYRGASAAVTISVAWQLTGERLAAIDLRQVLRFLPEIDGIVETWIQFILRQMLSRYTLETLTRVFRNPGGFQQVMQTELQGRLEAFGVAVLGLDVICLPSAAVVAARVSADARREELQTIAAARAEEVRILAAARAEEVRALSQALSCGNANDHLVQLLAIDALRGARPHVVTSLGLGSVNRNGGGTPPVQFVVSPEDPDGPREWEH